MGGDRHPVTRNPALRLSAAVIPMVFVGGLFLYPVGRILVVSLAATSIGQVVSDPRLLGAAWFTLWQAAVSTVLTLVAAFPLTAVLARYRFPGRRIVLALVTVPFVLPTVVVGVAFLSLDISGSIWAILAAHVFYNIAIVVRTVSGVWSRIDPDLVDAARTLGAGRLRAFLTVTWPLIRSAVAAASAIVFLFCFTSFGVVLILGGLRYRTLEVEIYQQAFSFLDLGTAAALATIQLVGVVLIMLSYGRSQSRNTVRYGMVAETTALQTFRSRQEAGTVFGVVIVTVGLLFTPLITLVVRSFGGGTGEWGLAGWRFLVDHGTLALDPTEAMANSLRFAVVSTLIAVVVGGLAAFVVAGSSTRSDRFGLTFDTVLMLPLGASAVTIGLGFLVALGPLRSSWWLVPLAHALVAVPFVVRTMTPTLRSIRPELREAATMLGAGPGRVWREIDLPIVSRAVAVGAGFAAAISLGEFGATTFIARPATITLPTLIFRFLSRPGSVTYRSALAASVVLMIFTALVIFTVDRLRSENLGNF